MSETARESFESWAKKEWNYKPHFIVSRYDKGSHKGEYVDPAIEHAWRAWCFVAAAKDAEVARLRQRVEELERIVRRYRGEDNGHPYNDPRNDPPGLR